ncbi:MAG: DUF4157 domain-containing protein [Alphaproteobacteria bacterium]
MQLKTAVRSERGPIPGSKPAGRHISPAHGAAEREADSTAGRVLRGQAPPCACGGGCPACIQPSTPARRDSGLDRGRPLDPATRAFFEPRFGRDLSAVRVHDDPASARSARMIGAKAFTIGADIAFARGRYAPDTAPGRALLAHELAHVVQHGSQPGTIFRSKDDAAATAAEVQRLSEEMSKLAAKNAWTGVTRAYEAIEALGPDAFVQAQNPADLHRLAAEAARNAGDTRRYMSLLQRAGAVLAGATGEQADAQRDVIDQALAGLKSGYGTVRIAPRSEPKSKKQAAALTGPALVRELMPFAADERKSIEVAAARLQETGYFSGMMPAGAYLLDGQAITVVAGTDNSFLWGN